jgi:hypothetical protein
MMRRFFVLVAMVLVGLTVTVGANASIPTTVVQPVSNLTILSGCGDVILATITGEEVLHFQLLVNGGFTQVNEFHGSLAGVSIVNGVTWTSGTFHTGVTLVVPPGGTGAVETTTSRIQITSSTGLTRVETVTTHITVTPSGDTVVSFVQGGWECS